jgi:hypothetical protein
MRTKITTWLVLAACAGILAVAWVLTDALGGMVVLPLLMALMAGGLLIARERFAPGAAVVAGGVMFAHAVWLLVGGGLALALVGAYAVCALGLGVCGLVLRASGWRPETSVVEI